MFNVYVSLSIILSYLYVIINSETREEFNLQQKKGKKMRNYEITLPWQRKVFDLHNELRSGISKGSFLPDFPRAKKMEHLLWDDELAMAAKYQASSCDLSSPRINFNENNIIDENLTFATNFDDWFGGSSVGSFHYNGRIDINNNKTVEDIMHLVLEWFYSKNSSVYGDPLPTEHAYIVRDIARYIGCGVRPCTIFKEKDGSFSVNKVMLVCNYYPIDGDNVVLDLDGSLTGDKLNRDHNMAAWRQKPYVEAKSSNEVCSQCPKDRTRCSPEGLCHNCPDINYFMCMATSFACKRSSNPCSEDMRDECPYYCKSECEGGLHARPDKECNWLYTPPPTHYPTILPTIAPTNVPTVNPTTKPTNTPTYNPTNTMDSQIYPTNYPTKVPTYNPTIQPTLSPISYDNYNSSYTTGPTVSPTPQPTWKFDNGCCYGSQAKCGRRRDEPSCLARGCGWRIELSGKCDLACCRKDPNFRGSTYVKCKEETAETCGKTERTAGICVVTSCDLTGQKSGQN